MKFLSELFLVLTLMSLTACVGDLDFDQIEDFETTQAITTSLINFDFDQEEDLDVPDGVGAYTIDSIPNQREFVSIPITSSDNFEKVIFEFEASNSFNGDFIVNVSLLNSRLDPLNNEVYTLDPITVSADTSGPLPAQEIDLLANPDVLNTTHVLGEIEYTGSITSTDPGEISFKSAGTFYYRTEIE